MAIFTLLVNAPLFAQNNNVQGSTTTARGIPGHAGAPAKAAAPPAPGRPNFAKRPANDPIVHPPGWKAPAPTKHPQPLIPPKKP